MALLRRLPIIAIMIVAVYARVISNIEPAFKPEPLGRGTVGLLINCLATFFFCVWTAMHPDIIPNPTFARTSAYKLTLMLMSVYMPESLIIPAWAQHREATVIRRLWCKRFGLVEGDKYDIGMEGAFLVVMGGIGVGPTDDQGKSRSILTAYGFKYYLDIGAIAKNELVRDIVVDKGKAARGVKILVLAQALWFVIGCAARVVAGLPITQLEIHIVIQVISALAAYYFWMFKPLDVEQPIHLNIDIGFPVPETREYPDDFLFITEDARPSIFTAILRAVSFTGEYMIGTKHLYVVALLIMLNGAFHASGYFVLFPSGIERDAWLIFSGLLCVIPLLIAFILLHSKYMEAYYHLLWRLRFTDQKSASRHLFEIVWKCGKETLRLCTDGKYSFSWSWLVMSILRFSVMNLAFWLIVCDCACVFGIMLLSVTSLRRLAYGAYSTPLWSNYVPQVS